MTITYSPANNWKVVFQDVVKSVRTYKICMYFWIICFLFIHWLIFFFVLNWNRLLNTVPFIILNTRTHILLKLKQALVDFYCMTSAYYVHAEYVLKFVVVFCGFYAIRDTFTYIFDVWLCMISYNLAFMNRSCRTYLPMSVTEHFKTGHVELELRYSHDLKTKSMETFRRLNRWKGNGPKPI